MQNRINATQDLILKKLLAITQDKKQITEAKCLEFKTLLKTLLKPTIEINDSEMRCEEAQTLAETEMKAYTATIDTQERLSENTLLMYACMNGHLEIVRQLINEKASLNIKNYAGNTALMIASREGYIGIVNELLAAKATLEIANTVGNSALDEAVFNDNLAIIILLLQHGAVIRNAKVLSDLLENFDARDPNVISLLEELCKGQSDIFHDYHSLEYYLEKLKALEKFLALDGERKNTFDTTLNAIDEAREKKGYMPKELVNIITCYNYLPLAKLPFFKVKDIDTLLINSHSKYQRIENIIKDIKKIGLDYLQHHTCIHHDNYNAANILSTLFSDKNGRFHEEEVAQWILNSCKASFNLAKSELLKNKIKYVLSTYQPFSHIDFDNYFSENTMTDQEWSSVCASIQSAK